MEGVKKKDPLVLRRADFGDASRTIAFLERSHSARKGSAKWQENDGALWVIETFTHGIVFNASIGNRIFGTCGFEIKRWGWSTEKKYMINRWFEFLTDENEKRAFDFKMIKTAEEYAKSKEMDLIIGGIIMGEKIASNIRRLFAYKGLQSRGDFYVLPYQENPDSALGSSPRTLTELVVSGSERRENIDGTIQRSN